MNFKNVMKLTAIAVSMVSVTAFAGSTYNYTMDAKSYSGSRDRDYSVYVPTNVSNPAPLVMVLHGCVQDEQDALNEWGMKAKADAEGFILVTPFITTYDGMRSENCWGFWFDQHNHEGGGEPEDLYQIALEVEGNYTIDTNKRYITGLSSGGAMTVVAAVTHNEYWTAAASASGLAYGETSSSVALAMMAPTFESVSTTASDMKREIDSDYQIPMMVLQNNNDEVVQQPAGYNIRDSFLKVFGASGYQSANSTKASEADCSAVLTTGYNCKHTKYTVDGTTSGRSVVETIFYDGPANGMKGHYWVGGTEDNYCKATGPDYPTLVWNFFAAQTRSGESSQPNGVPTVTLNGDNPMFLDLNDTFTDPGATATDPEDGSLTVTADCSDVDTSTEGEYACTYSVSDSDENNKVLVRVVKVIDPSAPTASCGTSTASPSDHISSGRAVKGGDFNLHAMVGNSSIGYSFDTWSSVTLYEGESGEWFTQEPAVCHGLEQPASSCTEYYDSNYNHVIAGRAYNDMGYAKATGSGDNLGLNNTFTYTTLKETSTGYYELGSCQ